jgi:hypothetical protein
MRRLFHAALALMLCLALPSCSLIGAGVRALRSKKKPEPARDDNTVHMIGVVELVNPEQKFVLIRTHGRLSIAADIEQLKEIAPRYGLTLPSLRTVAVILGAGRDKGTATCADASSSLRPA